MSSRSRTILAFGLARIVGGVGNDAIRAGGGPFSFVEILGGPGNDVLRGGNGAPMRLMAALAQTS
jgi:Ca2+-binding RTX toxin-like protein